MVLTQDIHLCVTESVCMCSCVCTCMYAMVLGIYINLSLAYLLSPTSSARRAGQRPSGISLSQEYMGARDLNSGPGNCETSTSPIPPAPVTHLTVTC